MKFVVSSLFFTMFVSNAYAEIDYTQLDHNIRNYVNEIKEQGCTSNSLPSRLPTDGLYLIDTALDNPDFIHRICIRSGHYEECSEGTFSAITEFRGFKNSIITYNQNHMVDTNRMVCSALAYVDMYSRDYPDKNHDINLN